MSIGDCMTPRIGVLESRMTIKRKAVPQITTGSTQWGVNHVCLECTSLTMSTRLVNAGRC